nr:OTU domain-containing protein 5-B [Tanacetum cinerariifolium]
MVPSSLGSVHAYHDMAGHTKHFTTLRELLYMVEKTDLQKLLGAVDELYQKEDPNTFALLLWGDLHVLFQSLNDEDALDFWRFSCWFSTTPQMVFSSPWLTAKKELTYHEGTALSWLVQEQTALGKDKSNSLSVGSLLKTTWSSIHHLLTDEVLTSPEHTAIDQMLLFHDPAVFGVPADLSYWSPLSCWFLVAAAVGCCWYVVPAGRKRERDFSQFITEAFTSYCKRKRRDKVYGNNVKIQALSECTIDLSISIQKVAFKSAKDMSLKVKLCII